MKFTIAIFNFVPNGKYQIPLQAGDTLTIIEESTDWYRGTNATSNKTGIFPRRYTKQFSCDHEDATTTEVHTALREWHLVLRQYYKERKFKEFMELRERLSLLFQLFQNYMHSQASEKIQFHESLRAKMTQHIEETTRKLGFDVIVKKRTGAIATEINTGVVPLFRLHEKTSTKDNATGTLKKAQAKRAELTNSTLRGKPQIKDLSSERCVVLMELRSFIVPISEPSEVFFSIYSKVENRYLTEDFLVRMTFQGMPVDQSKIGSAGLDIKAVFRDVPRWGIEGKDLFLACRIVRKGKMVLADPKGTDYRRPFGGGIIELHHDMGANGKDSEVVMPMFTPSNERDFTILHELILKGTGVETISKARGICLGITVHNGDLSTYPAAAQWRSAAMVRTLHYPDGLPPGLELNDFYMRIESCEVTPERPTSARSVEISLKLRHDSGNFLTDCLHVGTGEKALSEWTSLVFYHNNTPRFGELLRLSLPLDTFANTHYYFEFKPCTKSKEKPAFAIAFFKPTRADGTVVPDGEHVITLLRPARLETDTWYLKPGVLQDPRIVRKGESLVLKTALLSTVITTNPFIYNLLNWKTTTTPLAEVLNRFTFVAPTEVRRFTADLFDAMFVILHERQELQQLCYDALVFTIGVFINEQTARNDRPALETYVQKIFNFPTAHKHLMSLLKRVFTQADTQTPILGLTLKTLEFIFKFIIASRLAYTKSSFLGRNDQDDAVFKRDLLDFFSAFNFLMSKPSPKLIGAQTMALRSFYNWFNDLSQIFSAKELAHIAAKFVESFVPLEDLSKTKAVDAERLSVINHLVTGPLFASADTRGILIPPLVKQLLIIHRSPHNEEAETASSLLLDILNALGEFPPTSSTVAASTSATPPAPSSSPPAAIPPLRSPRMTVQPGRQHDDLQAFLGLTGDLLDALDYARSSNSAQLRVRLAAVLLGVLHLGGSDAIEKALSGTSTFDRRARSRLHTHLLNVFQGFVTNPAFPENWTVLVLFQYKTILANLTYLATTCFLQRATSVYLRRWSDDERRLFQQMFDLLSLIAQAKVLRYENFSANKKELARKQYGDLRFTAASLMSQLWNCYANTQSTIITPEVVLAFLQLLTLDSGDLRQMGIELYCSLLDRDYQETQTFAKLSKMTIDALDMLSDCSLEAFRSFSAFFLRNLQEFFARSPGAMSATFLRQRDAYLVSITELLALIEELQKSIATSIFDDDRVFAILKLLEYLRQAERKESYTRYVNKLVQFHLKHQRNIEAGFALLLDAQPLEWREDRLLDRTELYAPQTERARKEQIYRNAIELLNKGHFYERSIELLHDLRKVYQEILFDFEGVADLLEAEAHLHRTIAAEDRYFPEYFHVAFYGLEFPPALRNKQFIYRGLDFERSADFQARITAKYSQAEVLKYTEPPPENILNGDGQWIQIFSVRPSSSNEMHGNVRVFPEQMPPNIRKFYEYNMLNTFVYSKRIKKNQNPKDNNDFKYLWTINYFFQTKDSFPNVQARSEVVQKTDAESSPLENALKTMERQNQELNQSIAKFSQPSGETPSNINPLTMILQGTIDAAVNGGVKNYVEAFFTEYVPANPTEQKQIERLRRAMKQQTELLDRALRLHDSVCPPNVRALQVQLEKSFESLQAMMNKF